MDLVDFVLLSVWRCCNSLLSAAWTWRCEESSILVLLLLLCGSYCCWCCCCCWSSAFEDWNETDWFCAAAAVYIPARSVEPTPSDPIAIRMLELCPLSARMWTKDAVGNNENPLGKFIIEKATLKRSENARVSFWWWVWDRGVVSRIEICRQAASVATPGGHEKAAAATAAAGPNWFTRVRGFVSHILAYPWPFELQLSGPDDGKNSSFELVFPHSVPRRLALEMETSFLAATKFVSFKIYDQRRSIAV